MRGAQADWSDEWPVRGVSRGEPTPSAGVAGLRTDGYRVVFDVAPIVEDADEYQDHLNNTAAVRMFNDLRIAYVASRLAPRWPRHVRRGGLAVVVRELHARYDSEGWMHERYVGGVRVVERRGKAVIVEQRLVEATSGRPLADAWILQLLVEDDRAVDWPDWYWEMVAEVEGRAVPQVDAPRAPWGPPR